MIKKLFESEMVRYVVAGGMTTFVNLASFFVIRLVSDMSRSTANIMAITLAILFAYFANGFFVFRGPKKTAAVIAREFVSFIGVRLFAMLVEVVGTNLLCDSFRYNELVSKIIVQVVVLVINYIFSKCFVFKENKKSLKKMFVDNYVMVICFVIPAVFMLVLWIVEEIGPFGGNSLTMVDSLHQYLPFFSDYQDKLKNEGSLFYTWDIGMGSNLLDIIAYYMSCPLNFIIVLFDREHLYVAMCLLISVKIALSGMTMASWLGHKCKNKNSLFIIPFALAYALSNYVIGYSWNLMWMDCIMILPLIMQGFEQMTEDGSRYKLYTFSLFYGLLCNYYICFMICLFLIIEFVLTNHKDIFKISEDLLRFAGTSALAAAMSSFLLIPAYLGLNTTASATRTIPESSWYGSIWDIIGQMFILTNPIKSQGFDGGVNLYCGTFAILLFGVYLLNTRIKWYEKLKNVIILVFLMASFNNTLLNYIWHGFHDQYGIPNRFSFLFIFVLLTIGYEAVMNIDKSQLPGVVIAIAAAFGFAIYADRNIEFGGNEMKYTWILFAVYGVAVMAYTLTRGVGRTVVSVIMTLLFMTEIVLSGAHGYWSNGTVNIANYYGGEKSLQAAVDSVKEEGFPYRTELTDTKVVDESIYYNMQGVSIFGSTVSNDLVNAMHGLGFYTGANEFLYDGANRVTNTVFGIRYVFRRDDEYMPYDMDYVDTVEGVDVYQNSDALSLGFMVDGELENWTSEAANMFESINNFVEMSTGVAGIFSQIYPEVTGSSADITITQQGQFSEYYALSDITPGILSFSLKFDVADEEDDLYIIANCNGISKVRIYVNGELQNDNRLQYQTYHVGHVTRGTKIEIEYCFNSGVPENTSARLTVATMNQDAYEQAYAAWSDEQMKIGKFEDGYVKGHVTSENGGLLFTSIPYDSGWTAYVDGKKVEIKTVAGAFIALDIDAGSHSIELEYFPRGLKSGMALTFGGWMIMAFLLGRKRKPDSGKKGKAENVGADDHIENEDATDRDGADGDENERWKLDMDEALDIAENLTKEVGRDDMVAK